MLAVNSRLRTMSSRSLPFWNLFARNRPRLSNVLQSASTRMNSREITDSAMQATVITTVSPTASIGVMPPNNSPDASMGSTMSPDTATLAAAGTMIACNALPRKGISARQWGCPLAKRVS